MPAEPNNAFLASIALYTEMVPVFEKMLAQDGGSLPRFYAQVRELASADKSVRATLLAQQR